MPLYNCEQCNYATKYKADFTKHTKTKKHRRNIGDINEIGEETHTNIQNNPQNIQYNPQNIQNNPQNIQSNPKFSCDFCKKEFTLFTNKRRHEIHRCKDNTNLMTKKIYDLEKEKKKLEKKIEKLLDKVGTINNTTNNTNNNTQNIIVVNNYGKENTDYLTVDKIKALLERPFDSVQELSLIHISEPTRRS